MKILFFSYAYPNLVNPGLGTFNQTMITGLAAQHEIRVVSPVPMMDAARALVRGRFVRGLNDSRFQAVANVRADYCPWYYTPKFFREYYGQFMRFSVKSTLDRALREFQPDIVLSYWTHPDGEVAVEAAHRFGIPAATIVGGTDVLINARGGARREAILNVLRNADGVIAVSSDIKKVLVSDGIPTAKIHLARRGTDHRIFHAGNKAAARRQLDLPGDVPVIISVGRLVDVKGHTYLLDACRILHEKEIPFRCCILGNGPLYHKLQSRITRLGLSKSVELRGSKKPSELATWYRAADITVQSSISEGVPNVLLESIVCGTPFVSSDVGGISEIADPQFDTLVPPRDAQALANGIALRLGTVTDGIHQVRRFMPPSMGKAAHTLSRILRSIASGQAVQFEPSGMLHETLFEGDVTSHESVTALDDLEPHDSATDSTTEPIDPSGIVYRTELRPVDLGTPADDPRGVVHELMFDHESDCAETHDTESHDNGQAGVTRYVPPETEFDELGRTAEDFEYRPAESATKTN